jgi:hypothetical protein
MATTTSRLGSFRARYQAYVVKDNVSAVKR